MSMQYYKDEMSRLLGDTDTYQVLLSDPLLNFKEELHGLVTKGENRGVLNHKEALYLDPLFCRTPIIYFLPKIHKSLSQPPGRPIVNGIDSVTSRLGHYIDIFLQPLVHKTEAYLKDTKHVINILKSLPYLESCFLVTADVGSLYTIINHFDALAAVKWALRGSDLSGRHQRFLIRSLDFCLLKNYFWYDHQFYLQTRGVAMGAKFAPSVANLFMAHWEEDAVFKDRPPQLICYRRYIDDLIIVWNGDMESLQLFMNRMDNNDKNIKLTWNVNTQNTVFLDLEIYKNEDGFCTRNFFKPTDRNSFIPLSSCHHKLWLCNIPRGQFIRLRRNCTSQSDFLSQSQVLAERFKQKGYDSPTLENEITRISQMERETILEGSKKISSNCEYKILLDYSIQHKKFERIVKKHWPILQHDRVLGQVLPSCPQFIYRKAPTLRDKLAPGVINPPKKQTSTLFSFLTGFFACGKCPACKKVRNNIKKRKNFIATATQVSYEIKELITCTTQGVVYMLECSCNLQYIGRTSRALHVRIGEHISNIKRGVTNHTVSRHFKIHHHKSPRDLKFWGIEKVTRHWRGGHFIRQLSRRESSWIYECKVLAPLGLNADFDLNCFIADR